MNKLIKTFFIIFLLGTFFFSNFPIFDNFSQKREIEAALDPNELEYHIDVGPVAGTATANYVYVAFFNPSGSGRTALIKRIAIRANANSTGNYVNLTLRRITAASGGTLIPAPDIPKKNSDSAGSAIQILYAGPTVTFAGTTNSRILGQPMPGGAGHFYSVRDITFGPNDEKLVIQPGEGVAVYQEAAGTTAQIIRVYFEWEEVTTAPAAQNEFLFAFPRVEVNATANYVYNSFFNPAGSKKVAIVKRIWFGSETCDSGAVYTNNIVIRRISAASGGTAISATDIPKKHTGSANSVMDFRYAGVTVTMVGGTDARLATVTPCGAAGQPHGFMQINFHDSDEKLILQPGEGIALMSDDTGDVDQLVRMIIEWQEVPTSQTPSAQNEYIWGSSRIEVAASANQVFYAFFNPTGSGKTAIIKRLVIRNDADTGATYQAITWRRITSALGGLQIVAPDIPKKNTGSLDSTMTLLWCGSNCGTPITVTFAGSADSRLLTVNGPGAVGQVIGHREIVFGNNEKLILQEGEGIALYTEANGDVDQYIKVLIEWQETETTPTAQNEYVIDPGPINGSTAANYVYASFFNPSGSGKTAVIKRISIRVDAAAAAVYIPMTLRRITSASSGTQIFAANIPKKNTGSVDPILVVRRTGVTVTFAGSSDSRIVSVTTPGAVGGATAPSITGYKELLFENDEKLILQEGEGIALYQEAAGDADFRVKILVEWQEVTSTPSSQGEYLMSIGPVTGSLDLGYVYASLFNPSTSNKNYVVKRIEIRANRTGALTSPGYIPATISRITFASGGTQILPDYIPKKHSGTAISTAEVRTTNPTVTFAGSTDSRLLGVTVPGAVNQSYGDYEILIVYQDEVILKPGEGLALYQEQAAGDTYVVFRFAIEWNEESLGNQPPTVSNVQLNNQTNITLIENSTVTVSATAIVTDPDGYQDIVSVSGKIYRSGVAGGKNCTLDNNNCYKDPSCELSNCQGNSCTVTCTISMYYHADPTDEGTPWESEYWRAFIQAIDSQGQTGENYSPENAPDVLSLLALDVTPSIINYGNLNPGERNDPLDKITTITATGNCSLDVNLSGTNMSSNGNSIPVNKQRYALSAGTPYDNGTSLSETAQEAELNCPKTTDANKPQSRNIWWGIEIPIPQPAGNYSGTNTFEAVKNELPWP